MEFFKTWLWLYPAIAMTIWTLIASAVGRLMPLNKPVITFVSLHLMLWVRNPKNNYLYQRPSWLEIFGYLVVGILPIAGLVCLVLQVCFIGLLLYAAYVMPLFDQKRRSAK